MSAMNDIYGMAFALWPAFYMTILIQWWNTGNSDIDQSIKDEKKLNFRMPDLYAYCRKDISYFFRYYLYLMFYTIIPVLVVS